MPGGSAGKITPVAKRRKKTAGAPGAFRATLSGWCDRLGELTVLLLLVGVPFVVVPEAQDPFRLPKLMAAEVLGLVSLAAFAFARTLAPAPPGETAEPVAEILARRPGLLLASVLSPFVVAVAVGWAVTEHPFHTRQAMVDFAIGVACLVGWATVLDARRLGRLLSALVVPGVGLAVLGAAQLHDLYQPLRFSGVGAGERLGVTALAGNAGDLGAFLVLPALVAQWRLAQRARGGARGWRRWAWGVALAVMVYGLAATQTLAALLALGLGSALFWAFVLPRNRRLPVLGGTVAALALVVLLVAPLRGRVVEKTGELDRLGTSAGWNSLLSGRLDGWRTALYLFGEHPVTGVGLGSYRAEFGEAKLELAAAGTPFFQQHSEPYFANAHSEVLEVAAEQGALGLVGLSLLLLGWGRFVLLPAWRAAGDDRAGAFLVAAFAAVSLMALVDFPLRVALVAYPVLLFLAWAARWATETTAGPPEASR